MSPLRLKCVLVVLLLMAIHSQSTLGFYFGRRHLYIKNGLGRNYRLTLHCWSKDDDLGQHVLRPNEVTHWSFYENLLAKTRFECEMKMEKGDRIKKGHFVVYDSSHEVRLHDCHENCRWLVRREGLFALDEEAKTWDFELPWPKYNI